MSRVLSLAVALLAPVAAAQISVTGNLNVDTTWAGTVTMTGDVTVTAGRTLTIQPGTVITAAATDGQGSGADSARVELIIAGTVNAIGLAGSPITFTGAGTGTQAWGGIRVVSGGTGTFAWVTADEMRLGFENSAALTLTDSTVSGSALGFNALAGSTIVTGSRFDAAPSRVSGGTLDVTACIFTANGGNGALNTQGGTTTVTRSTFAKNPGYGISSYTVSSCQSSGSVTVTSSIFSHNASLGVYRYCTWPSMTVSWSNLWGNNGTSTGGAPDTASSNYQGSVSLSNSLSANPLYANLTADNFRLTSRSPSRKAGASAVDQGALPYVSDATVGV